MLLPVLKSFSSPWPLKSKRGRDERSTWRPKGELNYKLPNCPCLLQKQRVNVVQYIYIKCFLRVFNSQKCMSGIWLPARNANRPGEQRLNVILFTFMPWQASTVHFHTLSLHYRTFFWRPAGNPVSKQQTLTPFSVLPALNSYPLTVKHL